MIFTSLLAHVAGNTSTEIAPQEAVATTASEPIPTKDGKSDIDLEFEKQRIIAQRRLKMDMIAGEGAYDRLSAQVKPHRCARYLDDILSSFQKFEFLPAMGTFLACMTSNVGQEPPRLYTDSPMFNQISELDRLKSSK
ncbi:hypothetical protein BASA50_010063 [Batrachochytrium salamandrivorans]|uniref:Uncharacterized protein n=1 Tax=Batrachochytrium salamandrivorans TaxID=1357716 RepID=A0ABQ8F2P3_9FUNG|nr:hypothetical protein BASA50_010063 [Batrachochytrium salamandrivorans]KAJ1328617.1 hypothetical protein BSLG_010349 [Batrachochytrium salamandrivorans]